MPAAQQPEGVFGDAVGSLRQPQADRPWQAGPGKVPPVSEGSSRFLVSWPALELEITVSEFFAFPLLCPLTPEPPWDYLISFPL